MQLVKVEQKNQIARTARLAHEIWEEYYPAIITLEQIRYMLETFQSQEAIETQMEEGMAYYLAVEGDAEIGYLAYAEEQDGSLFLSKIYISKEFRNRGSGREMFAFILGQAQERNVKTIRLTVNKNNTASIDTYLKMGFTIAAAVKNDIGSGFYMDDYVMEYVR
jgi:diamine N-acetyltransferase